MATRDIRIAVGFTRHPKTVKLRRRLGADGVLALLALWEWVADNACDGDLSGKTVEDLEIAADWTGEPGLLIRTLLETGFLDQGSTGRSTESNGSFNVHNWVVRNPWVAGFERRSKQARQAGKRSAEIREWSRRQGSLDLDDSNGSLKPVQRSPINGSTPSPSLLPSVPSPSSDSSGDAVAVSTYLADAIHSHSPEAKTKPESWVRDIDLALRIDKRTPEQLRQVIDFAHRNPDDDFWRSNLLSGKKLREKFDQLAIKAKGRGSPGVKTSARAPSAVTDNRYPEKR